MREYVISTLFECCRSFCSLDEVVVARRWQFCCTTRTLIRHQRRGILQRRLPTPSSQTSKHHISSHIHLRWWPEKEREVEKNGQEEMQILRVQWTQEFQLASFQSLSEQKSLMFRNQIVSPSHYPFQWKTRRGASCLASNHGGWYRLNEGTVWTRIIILSRSGKRHTCIPLAQS